MPHKKHILLWGDLRMKNSRDKRCLGRVSLIAESDTTLLPCSLHGLQMGIDILGIGGRHFGKECKKVVFLGWGKELFRSIAQRLTVYKEYFVLSLAGKLLIGKSDQITQKGKGSQAAVIPLKGRVFGHPIGLYGYLIILGQQAINSYKALRDKVCFRSSSLVKECYTLQERSDMLR